LDHYGVNTAGIGALGEVECGCSLHTMISVIREQCGAGEGAPGGSGDRAKSIG
jgi:hypothetical protein